MARSKLNNIIGNKYNYLLVTGRSNSNSRKFVCLCDCGKITETTKQRLTSGRTKSCGCKKSLLCSEANKLHGAYIDGKNSPTYQSYIAMLHRCHNPNRVSYDLYGGFGIVVEESRWLQPSPHGYLSFLEDMGERPQGTSIDRIDGKLGYSKENCRWASRRLQAVNTDHKKTSKNTSKYRGVSARPNNGKYMARIGNGVGGYEYLGDYFTEFEAAFAYNTRAFELHGDDAKLNSIFCAIDIVDAGVSELYYRHQYRDTSGLQYLMENGVVVTQI